MHVYFPQRQDSQKTQETKEQALILQKVKAIVEAEAAQLGLLENILPPNMVSSLIKDGKVRSNK